MGLEYGPGKGDTKLKESSIQNEVQIALSQAGHYNLRINSGQFWGGSILAHDGARLVLEHPTKIMGAPAGTSDIIGCVTRTITPEMVGQTVAIFAALEVKRPGERPEKHQERYLALMRSRGAITGWATSPEEAVKLWTP